MFSCTLNAKTTFKITTAFTGEEKAGLVERCVKKLQDMGVTVAGVTCDGMSNNCDMLSSLGASISQGTVANEAAVLGIRDIFF
jgi:hypothetical protein